VIVLTSAHPAAVPAAVTPTNFTDEAVVDVPAPTALAFLPDGRMLVASQQGQLYLYGDDLGTVLDLGDVICSNSERGLLGVAVDPEFTTNRFIFVYYTANRFGCDEGYPRSPVNRVARFVLPADGSVERSSEMVLVDNIPSPAGNHNGGDVKFGHDGFLYISVGDGGCDYAGDSGCAGANDAARDNHALLGKILRITRDGEIPANNPFLGGRAVRCNQVGVTERGNRCQETWATGLRNPYRIAFDQNPGGSRLYINDVGQGTREEIDVGIAGADYGWNMREGACERDRDTNCSPPPPGLTDPLVDYRHEATDCTSITGGAFAPYGWPVPYHRSYFFGDFICGKIFWIATDKQGKPRIEEFATDVGRIVAMEVGPGDEVRQALYYTTYSNDGEVRRIIYTGTPLNQVQVQLPLVFR
jgi:glucose/arabinose dehydrogenase